MLIQIGRRAAALAAVLAVAACGRQNLSQADALQAIRSNGRIAATDAIVVEAISHQPGATEAIAKTTFNGSSYNLKLRRYDRGWTWEFVETVGGQWIAPSLFLEQVRETDRKRKASTWAASHEATYREAARLLSQYAGSLPRRPEHTLSRETWEAHRRLYEQKIRANPEPNEKAREYLKLLDDPRDPWGTPMSSSFDDTRRTARFAAAGPDKAWGTADDLVCVQIGRKEWDDMYETSLWNYYRSWIAPEGLERLLTAYADTDHGGVIETRKVVE